MDGHDGTQAISRMWRFEAVSSGVILEAFIADAVRRVLPLK